MNSHCLSIPGIRRLSYISTSYLSHDVTYRADSGVQVLMTVLPTDISLKGEAVCEVERKFDNNSQQETAKLTFYTLDELPPHRHLAFVITDMQGNSFVVGAREAPFPIVRVTFTTGKPDGDASVRKYEVSFTARKGLALCSV